MIWIVIFVIAAAAAADYGVWRRYVLPRAGSSHTARIVLGALWTADAVPLLMKSAGLFIGDNTQTVYDVQAWIMFAYAAVVIPKTILFASLLASRRPALRIAGAAVAAATAGAVIYGAACGRTELTVSEVAVASPRLPESFDGFRIALFSDLHVGALPDAATETGRVVDAINSLDADIVFFCGDLVNIRHTELDSACMAQLGRIRSVYGTYSVTGNHDTGYYVVDTVSLPMAESRRMLLAKERQMGWHPLDGRSVHIRRGSDSISVTGIPFFDEMNEKRHSRRIPRVDISAAYDGTDDGTFNITLAHLPQMWQQVKECGRGDLTLAGHVHAMQMKISLFGIAFSPARLQYRCWSGLYGDAGGGYLYINDGIGAVGLPVRIGARPEITLITLHR